MSAYLVGYVEVCVNGENLTIDANEKGAFSLESSSSSFEHGSHVCSMRHKHFGDGFILSIDTTVIDNTVTEVTNVTVEEGDDIEIIEDEIYVEIRHLDEDDEDEEEEFDVED